MAPRPFLPPSWSRSLLTDDRSIAASRIALGLLVLLDCAERATALDQFYTDDGFVPRSSAGVIWTQLFPHSPRTWSLHALSGSLSWQYALLALEVCAAIAFTLGYRARVAAVGVFVLFLSHCQRNALVCDGQDWALVAFLLWSIFVPLDRKWALRPRASEPQRRASLFEMGSFAFTAQLVMLLFFAGMQKLLNSEAWRSGDALSIILRLELGTTALGRWVGRLPDPVLSGMTYSVLVTELVLPWLLLVPVGRLVRGAALVLIGLQLVAFAACLRVGLLPWVVLAALLFKVPSFFWNAIGSRPHTSSSIGSSGRPSVISWIVPAVGIVHALLLNVFRLNGEFSGPAWLDAPSGFMVPRQGWRMYSTAESSWRSSWIVLAADPADAMGSAIRLPDSAPLTLGPESGTDNLYGDQRFRIFWNYAADLSRHHPEILERVLQRQCREFQIQEVDIVLVKREADGKLSHSFLGRNLCGGSGSALKVAHREHAQPE